LELGNSVQAATVPGANVAPEWLQVVADQLAPHIGDLTNKMLAASLTLLHIMLVLLDEMPLHLMQQASWVCLLHCHTVNQSAGDKLSKKHKVQSQHYQCPRGW